MMLQLTSTSYDVSSIQSVALEETNSGWITVIKPGHGRGVV